MEKLHKNKKHGIKRHPLYAVWDSMKARCYNKKNKDYKNYGARGVRICEEWRIDFLSFCNWAIENGWEKGLQIDKDMKGDGLLYSPKTCSIVTPKQNYNATRRSRYFTFNGKTKTMAQWAELFNIKYASFKYRIYQGWDIEKALTTPVNKD